MLGLKNSIDALLELDPFDIWERDFDDLAAFHKWGQQLTNHGDIRHRRDHKSCVSLRVDDDLQFAKQTLWKANVEIQGGRQAPDVSAFDRRNDLIAGNRSLLTKRSEEHTSELQSLMRISYAVFCLKKKKSTLSHHTHSYQYKK